MNTTADVMASVRHALRGIALTTPVGEFDISPRTLTAMLTGCGKHAWRVFCLTIYSAASTAVWAPLFSGVLIGSSGKSALGARGTDRSLN